MKSMSLQQVASACGGVYVGEEDKRTLCVSGVVIDSRQVEPGFLYIPMRGARVDGHSFIPDVFAKGAAAVLSEEELIQPAGPYIRVGSCPQALKDLAEYYRSVLDVKVVGITGSVGKTSTKEMIAAVLSRKYRVLKTEGNFNNEIGLPLTILRIREEHEAAVIEMGISDFGEMHRLAKIARPDICVMTNIGQCHLEQLKTRDGILKAKSEIFDFLAPDGTIILNGNDDKLSSIGTVRGVVPLRYFVEDGSAPRRNDRYLVRADAIRSRGLHGVEADLHFAVCGGGTEMAPDAAERVCHIREPIPGIHNLYNACAAACVGCVLGLSAEEICAGISAAQTIDGRSNLIEAGGITIIDDCYNANPVSMRASLDVLSLAEGRKIAVLGDMGELGENERELHRQIGAHAAEKGIDILYCTGALSRELAEAAGGCIAAYFENVEDLTEALLALVREGDTVLVKASHFMGFPRIVKALEERK